MYHTCEKCFRAISTRSRLKLARGSIYPSGGGPRSKWTLLGLPWVPKGPQGGPIRLIIMYYTCEKCFRAISTHSRLKLARGSIYPSGGGPRSKWTLLGPPWVPKRPQGGPIRLIIIYYTCEKCFRAISTHSRLKLARSSIYPNGRAPRSTKIILFVVKNF